MTTHVRDRADAGPLAQRDPARQHHEPDQQGDRAEREARVADDPLREDVPRHAAEAGVDEHRDRGGVEHEADQQLHAPAHGSRVGRRSGSAPREHTSARPGRSRALLEPRAVRGGGGRCPRPSRRTTNARATVRLAIRTIAGIHMLMVSNAGSQLAIAWNSHFWHSGLVITPELPADRRISGHRLGAVLGAWQRPGPAYVALADARPGRDPLGHRPAQHPPPERARARRRHRRLAHHDDRDVRAAARRGLPGEPARVRHGHHPARRSGRAVVDGRDGARRARDRRPRDGRAVRPLVPARRLPRRARRASPGT